MLRFASAYLIARLPHQYARFVAYFPQQILRIAECSVYLQSVQFRKINCEHRYNMQNTAERKFAHGNPTPTTQGYYSIESYLFMIYSFYMVFEDEFEHAES